MKILYKLISFFICIALICTAIPITHSITANAATSGYYTYTVSNGKATITDCSTSISGSVTIPSTLRGYPVTSIYSYAFSRCDKITDIIIPNGITSIGSRAFEYCTNLQNIELPDTISVINNNTFHCCGNLEAIIIPNGVKTIKSQAFVFCYDLTSVTIPDSVTTIEYSAFSHCYSLTDITIPKSVTNIMSGAFNDSGITNITIPASVTNIGDSVFFGCDKLENITVDKENTKYVAKNGILFNKNETELICYPASKTEHSYTVPNNITSIADGAFGYCTNLVTIILSDNIVSIGSDAFGYCTNLQNIKIPNSVTYLGSNAFHYCEKITNIVIPNSIKSILTWTFQYCSNLESITIPESIETIDFCAFQHCINLKKIIIPQSVEEISDNTFNGCDSLTIYGYIGSYAESYAKENDIPFRSIGYSQTDSYEKIACEYPQYLKNSEISNEILSVYQNCAQVVGYYSQDNIARLCALDAIANGSEIVTKQLLSLVGGETAQQTWEKETATMLVQKLQGNSDSITKVWDDLKKVYDYSELTLSANQTNKKAHLIKFITDNHPNINYYNAESIVNHALERTSFQSINDFSTASDFVVDCMDVIIFAFELYDIEIALVGKLMESVPNDTSLYEGLSLLKQDLEKEPQKYISEKILTDTVVYKIIDVLTEKTITSVASASGANIATPVALIDLMVDIFYTVFVPCNIDDLNRTIIAYDYALTINTELLNLQSQMIICKASNTTLSQDVIEDYKFLWRAYVAGLRCYLEMAIASDKYFTMKRTLKNQEQTLDTEINFDKYINCCLTELLSDINSQKIKCEHIFAYKTNATVSTCTDDSYYIFYCPTCATSFEEINTTAPANGHDFVSKTVLPTCETAGYTLLRCKTCGITHYTDRKSAIGHNYILTTVTPTCHKGGYTLHKCTNCSHQYTDSRTTAVTHNFIATEIISPTCKEEGYTVFTCNNGCNVTKKAFFTQQTAHIFTNCVCSCGLRGGELGEIKWTLDTHGTMKIQGTGIIGNNLQTEMPWNSFSNEILNIELSDNIYALENYAFSNCKKLQCITIPYSVKTISKNAFENCNNFTINCYYASVAKTFAQINEINYSLISVHCDASGDGKLNSEDLSTLRKHLLNSGDISPDGDCNQDKSINVLDLINLKKELSYN